MSKKYVIEIKPEYEDSFKGLMILGTKDSNLFVDTLAVENLEELNSDYINEHFGDLQDTAYQRGLEEGKKATFGLVADASNAEYQKGFEDGKAVHDKGCEGCKYETIKGGTCVMCCNNYKNQWTAKKQDDEIKVGDEVRWGMDLIVITRLYMNGGFKWCDGISKDGIAFHVLEENVSKTNRHFDIESIMEAMSEAQ